MTAGFLGIDLGTSGVKAVVVDATGTVRASATRAYPLLRSVPAAAEADPGSWWDATLAAAGLAVRESGIGVAAVGVVGQMHGLVLLDDAGRPVRNALTWADGRAAGQLPAWRALPPDARARLANPLVPGMFGPLLGWVRDHDPSAFAAARWAVLPKDWLRSKLIGVPTAETVTDPSDASATLLWDLPGDRWAVDVAGRLGLDVARLPSVVESADVVGRVHRGVATELGLPAPAVVVAGGGDTAAALLGTGLPDGDTQLTVGTGAQLVRPVAGPIPVGADPVTHLYRAAEPERWYVMAAVQNAGLALDWARTVLGATWAELEAALTAGAAGAGPGAGRLPVFVPYLTGERTPVLDDAVRARLDGLDLGHTRAELLGAVQLGVACVIRHALDALPGTRPEHVRLAGGGTAAPAMRQLLADVLDLAVLPPVSTGASARGAAVLAARAVGTDLPPAPPAGAEPVLPGPVSGARQEEYARYRDAVTALLGGT